MKTNIVLNIGLESVQGNPVELHHAIHEIERAGITCLASGVVRGQWEGREEQTLVISGLAYDSPELIPRLYCASRALSQHCIALWKDGKGELIGEETNFKFDPELFHFHPREPKPVEYTAEDAKRHTKLEESECERIQRIHREKADAEEKAWQDTLCRLRQTFAAILSANKWKKDSAKARAAEYAFTLGAEALAGKPIAYLSICRSSGRSILD
jgi:hypothetical protein